MKRIAAAAAAAMFAALLTPQGAAAADGYHDGYQRMHRHHGAWRGDFRHVTGHHRDWRWRHAAVVGPRYYGPQYADEDVYPPAPPYAYPRYAGYPAYSGCYSGCAPILPSCYSYSYGCQPYSGCGYAGGCGGGLVNYLRCGGC